MSAASAGFARAARRRIAATSAVAVHGQVSGSCRATADPGRAGRTGRAGRAAGQVGLLDTGIFIAAEASRPLGRLPDRVAVSVVTIGELELGVLAAEHDDMRARRADTLALARESDPIPITESVMTAWAQLVHDCRRAGIHRRARLTDALIAATASTHGLPAVTQDADFDRIASAHAPLRVTRV